MRARSSALLLSAVVAALAGAAPARAAIVEPLGGPASATNGIAFGADGNLWVAEANNGSVARISPEGQLVQRFPLGGAPSNVTTGPGGRVWVSVPDADKLVAITATAATPTATSISTAGVSNCGPVGITDGGNGRIYFSLPNDSSPGCTNPSRISSVKDTATDPPAAPLSIAGSMTFDLAVSSGKLFAPDLDGDVIRRLTLDATPVVDALLPVAGGPNGITVDGNGILWATAFNSGQVARFAPTAGAVTMVGEAGKLSSAFGIAAAADGRIYVAGADSKKLLRLNNDGSSPTYFAFPADSRPWQLAFGPGADLFVSDLDKPRFFRFVSAAPRATTGPASASSATAGSATATVDPRGNDTQVVFDYGTTTAYGQTTTPTTIPAGTAPVPVSAELPSLIGGNTYHVRVRATNGEGTTSGADTTLATPALVPDVLPAGPPAGSGGPKLLKLNATASFTSKAKTTTVITSLRLSDLAGGETATILCSGSKKCPFKTRTYKALGPGTKTLGKSLWKGRKLPKGVKVTVRIERPGYLGTSTVLTVRKKKKPTVAVTCVAPGTTAALSCG